MAAGTLLGASGYDARGGVAIGAIGMLLLAHRRSRVASIAGVLSLSCGMGLVNSAVRGPTTGVLAEMAKGVPRCRVAGEVAESAGGLGTLVRVDSLSCHGWEDVPEPGELMLDERAAAGEVVEADGYLVPLKRDGFDAARKRLGADAAFAVSEFDLHRPERTLLRVAAGVREGMQDAVANLEPGNAALLRGLTIGDTAGFDAASTESYRRSGLAHLVAVSGSNVAIVLGAFVLLARPLGLYPRFALAGGALLMYVLIVGPEPSVLRAGAMGAIGLLALAVGERSSPAHALALALVAVVALKPALLHSTGLHLSAAATAGIVLWTPGIAARLRRCPRAIAVAIGVTLAAQIAVAPLIIGVFGQLSLTGPVANVLAAPAVAPATILGLAAGVTATVNPAIAGVVARAAEPFAWWIDAVARSLGMEWAAVEVDRRFAWVLLVPTVAFGLVPLRRARNLEP
ncbi:MAG: ComEC/Rec2 family competence protein [Actinomycetota bacterium]